MEQAALQTNPKNDELPKCLMALQEDIRNILMYTKHLESFGEKSYEAASVANNKLEGVS